MKVRPGGLERRKFLPTAPPKVSAMTTFEHAMLGVNGALASGLTRRFGWRLAAMAGVVAASADWDGLAIVFSTATFAEGHRVWGHNLLVASLLGVLLAAADYRFDFCCRGGRLVQKLFRVQGPVETPRLPDERRPLGYAVWIAVGAAASLSHLAADLVVSGTRTLPDWRLQLLWPFSDRDWVFPLIRWGDVGVTVIFAAGMFALAARPKYLQAVAALTLTTVVIYLGARGFLRG